MFEQLFSLPLWVSGPFLLFSLIGISVAGLGVARRWVLPRLSITVEDSEFVGTMVQGVLVFYGLVLALILVSVWENYSQVTQIVSQEATAIGVLYRDASTYPEPARSELRAILKAYTRYVIEKAWPQARAGKPARGGVLFMDQFQEKMRAFEPNSEGEKIKHAEALRAYNHLLQTRRMRLDTVSGSLPGVMWILVLVGGAIAMAATYFFSVRDFRLHATMVSLLASFMALVIFMILALDRPYHGDLGIGTGSYELIYEQLMKN